MYSYGSLIGMIYDFLETGDETDRIFKIVPQAEKDCLRLIDKLSIESDMPKDIYYEATKVMLANEIKGFISGIYFALKLKDEFKEDMDKIKECLDFKDK